MAEFLNKRDIMFLLNEIFDIESLTKYDYYQDHNSETFNMIIDTALKIGEDIMYPVFSEMDKHPPYYQNGQANVHPAVRSFMDECGNGGWINASWEYDMGGQQIPNLIKNVIAFIFQAANYSLSAYPVLTTAAANLMNEFASQEIRDKYLDKLVSAQWQGTMALTEPNVGSSLGDLTTNAEDTGEGYFKIKGKKIFISAADVDQAKNTVHMMLARVKGAPAGVKGISLFVVPKYRLTDNGDLEFNDVICEGIEHKLGYKGCPIGELTMGDNNDCRGYLVGDLGKGLSYMFHMMNEMRIEVGLGATAKITAAYYAALNYTRQRLQGRKLNEKDPATPMIPIIEHTDVKRMLLFQRAIAEGSLALALQLTKYMDLVKVTENAEDKEKYELLMELLVPIVKTYPAEMGVLSTSAAIQCLGGYGYCQDFPAEQYYRDIRIDAIHEGTTAIQGQDLLGRKITMKNGKALIMFIEEVHKTIKEAEELEDLETAATELLNSLNTLQDVTKHLLGIKANGKLEEFMADATIYLEMMSIITIAWQWLQQAIAAAKKLKISDTDEVFYKGKLYTCGYYYRYELPKVEGLAKTLKNDHYITAEMASKYL